MVSGQNLVMSLARCPHAACLHEPHSRSSHWGELSKERESVVGRVGHEEEVDCVEGAWVDCGERERGFSVGRGKMVGHEE